MSRSRILSSIAAAALGVSLLGACSAESLAEFGLERALESSAEGDVDIDLSNGGFNITSDEGDFAINFDEDNGGIFFDSEDGSGSIVFDDEGNIVYDTDEGSGTITVDDDGIVIDGDNAEGTIAFADDGNGGATITTEEGSAQFGLTTAPPTWPGLIGQPSTNIDGQTTYSVLDSEDGQAQTANFYHDAGENFAQAVIDRLTGAGFVSSVTSTTPDGVFAQMQNEDTFVMVIGDRGTTTVTIAPV